MELTGIIGGSGLENPKILKEQSLNVCSTQYGKVEYLSGEINGKNVVLLSRHGKQHTIPPSQVNYIGNIAALKQLGCCKIVATTACGSLREEIKPGMFVIPDQFIDFTRNRVNTFYSEFEPGNMGHVGMADPFDMELRNTIENSCKTLNIEYSKNKTLISIEGPRFSTRAESKMFRLWGADIINMTTATEAALANEAKIPYAAIAMATDYDCWRINETPVSWQEVLKTFNENSEKMIQLLKTIIHNI